MNRFSSREYSVGSSDPTALLVMLFSDEEILERFHLPCPPEGRYAASKAQLSFEGDSGEWHLRCGIRTSIFDKNVSVCDNALLQNQQLLTLSTPGRHLWLYTENAGVQSNLIHNYKLPAQSPVLIGATDDCDIICRNGLMSYKPIELHFVGKSLTVRDSGSEYGVYVNCHRVKEARLSVGDIIEMPGLRLVAGSGFISIVEGNGSTFVSPHRLRCIETPEELSIIPPACGRHDHTELFSPFPRNRTVMANKTIEIVPPPMSLGSHQMPFWMRMGSSMANGIHAAMMGNMFMLFNTMFFPALSSKYTKEEREKHEKKRRETYGAYLDAKWQELLDEKEREEQALRTNYPPLSEVLTFASDRKKLWSRKKTDDDFLSLRLGSGSYPMLAELDYPHRQFEMEPDSLEDEMYDIIDRKPILDDVPVMLDLKKDRNLGVLGDREARLAFARSMMMRISLLYSCDEVKLMLLADPEDLARLEFIRWLPHIWNDLRTLRYIAAEPSEAYQVGEEFSELMTEKNENESKPKETLTNRPFYVVFALSKRLFDSVEVFKNIMQCKDDYNIIVFSMFDDLPKECSAIIRLNDNTAMAEVSNDSITFLYDPDRSIQDFTLDSYKTVASDLSMRTLYRIEHKSLLQAYAFPKTYTFLEMYGVGRIEHLNILERWHTNDASRSLEVPIGIGTDGEQFMLNLHQKNHGPHGLVAGTTGSGKSEFLLTYILSLAINFHPDEVAFLLIDYKGGGLAGAFSDPEKGVHLPHLVGTITNLDGSAIMRSMTCIQSEMIRRQTAFQKAKSKVGEGTMDIYMYQKLYRRKSVDEPMPHLFIISDEFAELKQQQPDFLNSLVSIARVGRSLGVHLILATQKPGGIVTDQIQSNTKFRVCLKVQDRGDSMDMLKRPEACELRETGRFYFQVGNNELFTLGQAAWCGAEYEPAQAMIPNQDKSIQAIDNTGTSILSVAPKIRRSSTGQTQLVAIVRALSDLAMKEGIQSRPLWKPALPDKIDIDKIPMAVSPNPESVVFNCGIIDDPTTLSQFPLTLDLTRSNLLLVGDTNSGKTTFLQTMLCKLSDRYSSKQLNYYILDYSSRLLKLFSNLPHCGAVLTEDDDEQLDSFFDLIHKLAKERKALFSRLEVNSYEAACEIEQIPLILVIIDNLVYLGSTRKGQKQLDGLVNTIKSCGQCGIRFLISISHLNEAVSRVKQELPVRVTLHMRDRFEYGEALNTRCTYVPPEIKGRGLCLYDGRPLEMQLGMIGTELSEKKRIEEIKARIAKIAERSAGNPGAKRIKTISATETYEDFCKGFSTGRIPLGYDLNNGHTVALPLKQFSMMTLYFGNPNSIVPVLNNFLYLKQRQDVIFVWMRSPDASQFDRLKYTDGVNAFDATPEMVEQIINTLLWHINDRRNVFLQYCQQEGLDPLKQSSLTSAGTYLRSRLTPFFVLFERLVDLTAAPQKVEGLLSGFSSVCELAKFYNIFLIGCIYPDEDQLLIGSKLYSCFNPERLGMLFGGNLKKQRFLTMPYNIGKQDGMDAFNQCIMSYRGDLHPLMMPCGVLEKEILPEDDRPIFEQAE